MTNTPTQTQKVDATQTSASGQKVDASGQSDATRMAAAQAAGAGPAGTAPKDTTASKGGTATTATGGAKGTAKPKAEGEGRGRKSQYSGMTLRATVEANPRREGSHGFKSLGLILAAGKNGISYEDYIKKGGRLNDLVWDINKDHVVAEKPKA
jgi:hypothetical protein